MHDELRSDLASLRIDRSSAGDARSSGNRALWTIVVLGALGAAGFAGFTAWKKVEPQVRAQEVETVEVGMISPSQAEVLLTATGYVTPMKTSKVGAKIQGRIAKVFVKEGDAVEEGTPLAQVDDIDQRAASAVSSTRVGTAQARVATAKANLADISQQVERTRSLVKTGAVGQAQLEDLVAKQVALAAAVKAAEAEVVAARADVNSVSVGIKDSMIVAPMSGRVVTKPVAVGEMVGPSTPPITEIVDFKSLVVEVDVPESRLLGVKVGGPAEIVLDAYPNHRYRGTVVELGQRVSRAKGTLPVKVKFDDDLTGVLPEMSARVSILSKAIADDAVDQVPKRTIPPDVVVDRDGRKVVFAVEDQKLRAYPVKLGGAVGSQVELIEGPPAGTRIVARPTPSTTDGDQIKERDK